MSSRNSYYYTSGYRRGTYSDYNAYKRAEYTGYNRTNYNRTSVAYNYPPVYYADKIEDEIEVYKRSAARADAKEKKERIVHKTRLIISIVIIFCGLILMMCSYTAVHMQRIENSNLREQLISLQSQNATILADISADLSVDYIRNEAINRLGMVEPQDYQKVYIDVDEQSYTVSYTEEETEAEEGFSFSGLIKFLKGE